MSVISAHVQYMDRRSVSGQRVMPEFGWRGLHQQPFQGVSGLGLGLRVKPLELSLKSTCALQPGDPEGHDASMSLTSASTSL